MCVNSFERCHVLQYVFQILETLSWSNIGSIEQHIGCNINIYGCFILTDTDLNFYDVNDESDNVTFVRSINGNQAQKSGDSGYSDREYSSQDSLISNTGAKLNLLRHSAVNVAFTNDEYNVPGYVSDNLHQHKKYASTLAIPRSELLANKKENGIELKQFISPFPKLNAKSSVQRNGAKNVNKILLIGDSMQSKSNYCLYTLTFE